MNSNDTSNVKDISESASIRTGMAGRWRRAPCEVARAAAASVDEALQVPPLQRLALARVVEMEIRETDSVLEASGGRFALLRLQAVFACQPASVWLA